MSNNPVGWFDIYVQDLQRAKAFYENVFGLELARLDGTELARVRHPRGRVFGGRAHGRASARRMRSTLTAVLLMVAMIAACERAFAQIAQMGICKPISQRTEEVGCWIITNTAVGQLPEGRIFWHLDIYPTRAAAEEAKGPRGTVVEAFGKLWLFTIADAGWRPSGGERVAEVGPLPVSSNINYTAQYMESTFTPGMTAPAHRHPGAEAWYAVSGETCLETPEGKSVSRPGGPHVIVPSGRPMHLTATGRERRQSLVLVLHDSTQPAGTPAPDWTPKGLCKN